MAKRKPLVKGSIAAKRYMAKLRKLAIAKRKSGTKKNPVKGYGRANWEHHPAGGVIVYSGEPGRVFATYRGKVTGPYVSKQAAFDLLTNEWSKAAGKFVATSTLPSPSMVEVKVWEERDRLHIELRHKFTGKTIAEWWDDDARQMFEDGFFKSGRYLDRSVIEYAQEMGLLAKGNPLYVGLKSGKREVFRHPSTPTEKSHGDKYGAVIGPFRTKPAAELMAGPHGPLIQTVSDAERAVRSKPRRNPAGGQQMWDSWVSIAKTRGLEAVQKHLATIPASTLRNWIAWNDHNSCFALFGADSKKECGDCQTIHANLTAKDLVPGIMNQIEGEVPGAQKNPASGPADATAARELQLYIENEADLYRQQHLPIIANLMRKRAAGIYDHELAVKLFMYLVESGAKKYAKEFSTGTDWSTMFNKNTRLVVAAALRDDFEAEADLGSYTQYIPKKYQKNPLTRNETNVILDKGREALDLAERNLAAGFPVAATMNAGMAFADGVVVKTATPRKYASHHAQGAVLRHEAYSIIKPEMDREARRSLGLQQNPLVMTVMGNPYTLKGGDKQAIRNIVSRMNVGMTDAEVSEAVVAKLAVYAPAHVITAVRNYAAQCHRANQKLYGGVARGMNPGPCQNPGHRHGGKSAIIGRSDAVPWSQLTEGERAEVLKQSEQSFGVEFTSQPGLRWQKRYGLWEFFGSAPRPDPRRNPLDYQDVYSAAQKVGYSIHDASRVASAFKRTGELPMTVEAQLRYFKNPYTGSMSDISQWIDNDEGLYNWWRSSRMSKTAFIRENRAEIDAAIRRVLGQGPKEKTWRDYTNNPGPKTKVSEPPPCTSVSGEHDWKLREGGIAFCGRCGYTPKGQRGYNPRRNPSQTFDVFLDGKHIDTVFYGENVKVDVDEVKRSLVNHDGYDPDIEVKKRRASSAGPRGPLHPTACSRCGKSIRSGSVATATGKRVCYACADDISTGGQRRNPEGEDVVREWLPVPKDPRKQVYARRVKGTFKEALRHAQERAGRWNTIVLLYEIDLEKYPLEGSFKDVWAIARPHGGYEIVKGRKTNPLNRSEAAYLLRRARGALDTARQYPHIRKVTAGRAMGLAEAVDTFGPRSGLAALKIGGRGFKMSRRSPKKPASNNVGRKTNPGKVTRRKVTMTLEAFAKMVKAKNDPKLWAAFLKKVEAYKKWSHGTLPKKVTVEQVDVPGMSGMWMTYDAGKAPETAYVMPRGTKRKGAWVHQWDTMPDLKNDPESGIVLTKLKGKSRITDFYHR